MKLNNYRIIFKLILRCLAAPLEHHWGPLVGRDPPVGNPWFSICEIWTLMEASTKFGTNHYHLFKSDMKENRFLELWEELPGFVKWGQSFINERWGCTPDIVKPLYRTCLSYERKALVFPHLLSTWHCRWRDREMLDECIILANKCTMLCGQLAMFHVFFFLFWCCINTKAYRHSKASQNGTFVSVCVCYVVLYCFFLTRTNSILSIVPLSKRRLALPRAVPGWRGARCEVWSGAPLGPFAMALRGGGFDSVRRGARGPVRPHQLHRPKGRPWLCLSIVFWWRRFAIIIL